MENLALPIVIVGHIDHGKSTLIGRLLYGMDALKEDRKDDVYRSSSGLGRDIEYAFALDALEEEREGALTIDTTQAYFSSAKRRYAIVDAPGHREFLKNMLTGTSYAEAAVLVVDAVEGVQEQTKRHAYLLNLVGIRNIIVAINKMDMVDYNQRVFDAVRKDIMRYMHNLQLAPKVTIPISAKQGINITDGGTSTPWYKGPCLLEALDGLEFKTITQQAFRYPVQDVYKINGDRIIVGRVESGEARTNMEVYLLPAARKCKILKIIKYLREPLKKAIVGESVGLLLDNRLKIQRGDVISEDKNTLITKDLHARIFWFDGSYRKNDKVSIKHTTQAVDAFITILNKLDPAIIEEVTLEPDVIEVGEVAEVRIIMQHEIVIDSFSAIPEMGRFIIEKDGIPAGGGIVL